MMAISIAGQAYSTVRILTFHCNRPDFLKMQHWTLEKFLEDEYELIVFNDARETELEEAISATCETYGIKCVRFEQEWHISSRINQMFIDQLHHPDLIHSNFPLDFEKNVEGLSRHNSFRHCHVIQYALDNYGYDHDDIVVILDGDMFPVRPVNIRSLLKNHDIAASTRYYKKEGIDYPWVTFIAMNMPMLPNKDDLQFHADRIGQYFHDSGANSYHYLKNNPSVLVMKLSVFDTSTYKPGIGRHLLARNFNLKDINFMKRLSRKNFVQFQVNNTFLHYGASSFESKNQESKSKVVMSYLNSKLMGN